MAASDIGMAVNGHIVAECAALQLPSMVFDPNNIIKSYYTQYYNAFDCEINIATRGAFYQELMMSTSANRISHELLDLFKDPKLRYYHIEHYSPMLRSSLATADV